MAAVEKFRRLTDEEYNRRLYQAYLKARKNKLGTEDQNKFELHLVENLENLKKDIIERTYFPSRSRAFTITDPNTREIFAAPFRDRIVHHFICDYIADWWDRRFIHESYSCRVGKGTDYGIQQLYKSMQSKSENFKKKAYVLKLDLSSYFCSIPRQKLFERVEWGLRRQFLEGVQGENRETHLIYKEIYETLHFLCRRVVFDDPVAGVRIKGSLYDWQYYPKRKSLFFQQPGIGIVIGNLTSQMFSNIFLDQVDHYCVDTLKLTGYRRYVDDMCVVMTEEEKDYFLKYQLKPLLALINGMGLKINQKKTVCQEISHGVEFLGAMVYPYHVFPSRRRRDSFQKIFYETVVGERDIDCLKSALGQMWHFDCQNWLKKVFNKYGQDFNGGKNGPNSCFFTNPEEYYREKLLLER